MIKLDFDQIIISQLWVFKNIFLNLGFVIMCFKHPSNQLKGVFGFLCIILMG